MSHIAFEGVSHSYGERHVLADISLSLTEGRIGIVGANGSGKSTLARMINGLVLPTRGRVLVDELDTDSDGAQVRRKVGFVFTDPDNQIVMPTVAEDVAFSLHRQKLPKDVLAQRVSQMLEHFGLAGHADHPAHLLSGGQKQLLALAAVLIIEPEVLIADEPTTLLDLRHTRTVATALHSLKQQLIVVTHQVDLLRDFDRVIVLHEGAVYADDAPAAALQAYLRLMA